jgi:hypothetical protein
MDGMQQSRHTPGSLALAGESDIAVGGAPSVVALLRCMEGARNGSASSPSVGGRDGDGAAVADLRSAGLM